MRAATFLFFSLSLILPFLLRWRVKSGADCNRKSSSLCSEGMGPIYFTGERRTLPFQCAHFFCSNQSRTRMPLYHCLPGEVRCDCQSLPPINKSSKTMSRACKYCPCWAYLLCVDVDCLKRGYGSINWTPELSACRMKLRDGQINLESLLLFDLFNRFLKRHLEPHRGSSTLHPPSTLSLRHTYSRPPRRPAFGKADDAWARNSQSMLRASCALLNQAHSFSWYWEFGGTTVHLTPLG